MTLMVSTHWTCFLGVDCHNGLLLEELHAEV